MGQYSQLYVDRLYFSWKNDIPTFLTFLFKEDDFFQVRNLEDPEWPEKIGFKTKCSSSIEVLDRNGYTIPFFADVYEFFLKELSEQFNDAARDRISNDNDHKLESSRVEFLLQEHLERYPRLTPVQQLEDFLRLLKVLLATDFKDPPFNEPVRLSLLDGQTYDVDPGHYLLAKEYQDLKIIDLENLQMYVLDKPLKFPPWILKLCALFDDGYHYEYPEIITLMFVRFALASVSPDSEVVLDLSDILDLEEDPAAQERQVRSLHGELAYSLVEKVNLYNRVFQNLFRNEEQIREQYIKSECRELLSLSGSLCSAAERGRLLERLTELLFTANRYFELIDKRVLTGDEEIDIIVKNNVDTPFWNALQSPLFFIECKNWNSKVGAKEMRDFEGKLRNHSRLVRVGFFVSINGFTKEALNELKRGSREAQHIVLLQRTDLQEYVESHQEFFAWLERRAAVLY